MAQRIKVLVDTEHHKKGEIILVPNNEAHALIEAGEASLYKFSFRDEKKDRMFRPNKQTFLKKQK